MYHSTIYKDKSKVKDKKVKLNITLNNVLKITLYTIKKIIKLC